METNLDGCPWCGEQPDMCREAVLADGEVQYERFRVRHFCHRLLCLVETGRYVDERGAAEAWNWRADDGD